MEKKFFSIVSLGCFRNNYDSEVLAKKFIDDNYSYLSVDELYKRQKCHTLIINTCGFIDKAKGESIEAIREAIDLKKKGKIKKIMIFGCLAQRYKKELEKNFPQIDEFQGVLEFNKDFIQRYKLKPYYLDYLKICEGCLNRCSFCAIPLIKGPLKSRPSDEVLKEVKLLDERKVKELNIIGQDITGWGKDLKENGDLAYLLKKILKTAKNIKWFRLIYTHPRNFSDVLIDLIAQEERICKYIDLPIQHINDRILKSMNRGVNRKEIEALISKIRKNVPDVAIRSSVIAGFAGESDKEFKELLEFLGKIKFDRLGVFIYSREEGTPAYDFSGQIHPKTKLKRYNQLMSLQQEIAASANERLIGKELDVLVEEKENGTFLGRTQYDAPEVDGVVFIKSKDLKIGDFYKAKITGSHGYDLIAV